MGAEEKKFNLDGRNALGRLSESKLYELMNLCQKTLDAMKEKGKDGTDNYKFFLDMWSAIGQCIVTTNEADQYRGEYTFHKEINQLLTTRISNLEQELNGYRVIEGMMLMNVNDQFNARVKESMKKHKALMKKLQDES